MGVILMINWIIGGVIIAALLAVVITGIVRAKRNGGIGCGCGCGGCSKASQCHPSKKEKNMRN